MQEKERRKPLLSIFCMVFRLCGAPEVGAQDDGLRGGNRPDGASLAAGTGKHIAHQNQGAAEGCQQDQGQNADDAAIGGHGQRKQRCQTDAFHSLSVFLHIHDLAFEQVFV